MTFSVLKESKSHTNEGRICENLILTLQKGKGVTNQVDKSDRRKANIHLTEIMIAAQEMMERAETRRDVKIAEAIYWCAMALEFLMKAPPEEQERKW